MVKKTKITPLNNISDVGNAEIHNPELFFGIVGPIGVNIDLIITHLVNELEFFDYHCEIIHITDYIKTPWIKKQVDNNSYYNKYKSLIDIANRYRSLCEDPAALAGLSMLQIINRRNILLRKRNVVSGPALGTAYILRQFKRPEEIELMRKVYGRKFIQISVFSNEHDRRLNLMDKIRNFSSANMKYSDVEKKSIDLIDIDHNQIDEKYGQRVSGVFHLGDVFVEGRD